METYSCKDCKRTLPVSSFSKTKLNKLTHGKIQDIDCIDCISSRTGINTVVNDSANSRNSSSSNKKRPIGQISDEISPSIDPSTKYLDRPKSAPMVKDAKSYFKSRSIPFQVRVGKTHGWRTCAKIAVRGELVTEDGQRRVKTSFGLFQPGSHKIVRCISSPVHHPSINTVLEKLEIVCSDVGVNGYIEDNSVAASDNSTYLKYVVMSVERDTLKVQLTLVWHSNPTGDRTGEKLLKRLKKAIKHNNGFRDNFHSVWVNYNYNNSYDNAILGYGSDKWEKLFGSSEYVRETLYTDIAIKPVLRFPPFVFRQANIDEFTKIVQTIRTWIKNIFDNKLPKCTELYGGVGTLGLNCIDLFSNLQCSDENPHNKECFEKTVLELPEELKQKAIYDSRPAAAIATDTNLTECDVVLVDPPRKGMESEVVASLITKRPSHVKVPSLLIYVSCGFKALKRDLAVLVGDVTIESGLQSARSYWEIIHAEGFVLFPGSDHIETLVILQR